MFGWISKILGQDNPGTKSLWEQNLEKRDGAKPINFGHKWIWAAISTKDTDGLLNYLQLQKLKKANWVEGTIQANSSNVFILPPIEGWILISGWGLPIPDHEKGIERVKDFLNNLSQTFGEAQLFGNHQVSNSAFWVKSVNGKIGRLYFIADGNNFIEGKPTEVEKQWDLVDSSSKAALNDSYWEKKDYPDVKHVLEVAENWSINPMELENRENLGEYGYLGKLKSW